MGSHLIRPLSDVQFIRIFFHFRHFPFVRVFITYIHCSVTKWYTSYVCSCCKQVAISEKRYEIMY